MIRFFQKKEDLEAKKSSSENQESLHEDALTSLADRFLQVTLIFSAFWLSCGYLLQGMLVDLYSAKWCFSFISPDSDLTKINIPLVLFSVCACAIYYKKTIKASFGG
jgi:hypothetical protein